jgi:Zn-dependent protease
MDRQYQIEFCKVCANQKFDWNKGIICSLTGERATFDQECPNFNGDRTQVPIAIANDVTAVINSEVVESSIFPPKPVDEISKQSIQKALINLALFVIGFNLLFKWELKYIIVLISIIIIHELGHYLAMRFLNYKDLGIYLVPLFGAFTTGSKDKVTPTQKILVILAGPIPGIIIGTALYYFALLNNNDFLVKTSDLFIVLNLFNLLPFMPLDGGNLFRVLFLKSSVKIELAFYYFSVVILAIIAIVLKSYIFLLVPLWLFTQIRNIKERARLRILLSEKGINTEKSFADLTDQDYWQMREIVINNNAYLKSAVAPKIYVASEHEMKIITLIKNILTNQSVYNLGKAKKVFLSLIWILLFVMPYIIIAVYYISLGIEI